jgi:hypothetical protein
MLVNERGSNENLLYQTEKFVSENIAQIPLTPDIMLGAFGPDTSSKQMVQKTTGAYRLWKRIYSLRSICKCRKA